MATRSRAPKLPVMSMLDLLFGVFGVMIVLAAALSQQRASSPRIDRTPFLEVTIGLTGADLRGVFIDFVHESESGVRSWSLLSQRETPAEGLYLASIGGPGAGASLTLPATLLQSGHRLRANLHNLSRLSGPGTVTVTLIARTAHNTCPILRDLDVTVLRQAEIDSRAALYAPSVFSLLAAGGPLCSVATPGLDFSVIDDGWIGVEYALD